MSAHFRADGITMRFAGLVANEDVDLDVRPGELIGLIGPNGAGKTTLFNCITGFLRPTRGRVWLDGDDITGLSPAARAARGIARTFQQSQLFEHLDVRENLLLGCHLRYGAPVWKQMLGLPAARRAEARAVADVERLAAELDLVPVLGRQVGDLPYGTRRLIEVARALAVGPRLLLLDEPSAGLDTAETRTFGDALRRVSAARQLTVLLIEHDVDLVLDLCERVYVLDFGRVIASGTPAQIRADERVRAAYLGTERAIAGA